MEVYRKEKDLFGPLKMYFKELGYTVYAEVPCYYRGVDFVAAKGDDHIAVEMKLHFNNEVVRQARGNCYSFGKSYVAFPVKKAFLVHGDHFWKLRKSTQDKVEWCEKEGVGIIQVLPCGTIFTALEAVEHERSRVYDFSQFQENESDEAGLPCQKGVSEGYYELKGIMEYVKNHPEAKWKEIYDNVQNHYSSHTSMAGSMKQWRGFSLNDYKIEIFGVKEIIKEIIEEKVEEEKIICGKLF